MVMHLMMVGVVDAFMMVGVVNAFMMVGVVNAFNDGRRG